MRALIVDPDDVGRGALAAEFKVMRIEALAVADGHAALQALETVAPSLVVVNFDVEGGGLPLIARLQAAARQLRLALDVFVVAGQVPPALTAAAAQLHVEAVLIKPVGRLALARALAKLLCSRVNDVVVEHGNGSSLNAS